MPKTIGDPGRPNQPGVPRPGVGTTPHRLDGQPAVIEAAGRPVWSGAIAEATGLEADLCRAAVRRHRPAARGRGLHVRRDSPVVECRAHDHPHRVPAARDLARVGPLVRGDGARARAVRCSVSRSVRRASSPGPAGSSGSSPTGSPGGRWPSCCCGSRSRSWISRSPWSCGRTASAARPTGTGGTSCRSSITTGSRTGAHSSAPATSSTPPGGCSSQPCSASGCSSPARGSCTASSPSTGCSCAACWARPRRPSGCVSWRPPGPWPSRTLPRSCDGSNVTCTTAPRRGWSRWR